MFRPYTIKETLEKLWRLGEVENLFDTAKELDLTYAGDFILSPPKAYKASISFSESIRISAD
jgi:hypothetical protein